MTDILPPAGWPNVRQLETNEFATGGSNGNMNEQAKSLAARSELLKQYATLPYESKTGGYALNERVQLATGDIVRSAIPSNVNNPNVDMTGWRFDDNMVKSIADLIAIQNPKDGQTVFVKSYKPNLQTGGGYFILLRSSILTENLATVFRHAQIGYEDYFWVRINFNVLTPEMCGANGTLQDSTDAIETFLKLCGKGYHGQAKAGKIYKTTRQLNPKYSDSVSIDFNGATIKADWTIPNGFGVDHCVNFESESGIYTENKSVSIDNLYIDLTSFPVTESTTAANRRGIAGLAVKHAEVININNFKCKNAFYGAGIYLQYYKTANLTNISLPDCGVKFNPNSDDTGVYDAAGDGIYLSRIVGDGLTTIKNLTAKSKAGLLGRGGVVLEQFHEDVVTTNHIVTIENANIEGYQRIIHQEDLGIGKVYWKGGSAKNFSNLIYNLGGSADTIYFEGELLDIEVAPPYAYGGTSGIQNMQGLGDVLINNCNTHYKASVAERGNKIIDRGTILIDDGVTVDAVVSTKTHELNNVNLKSSGGYLHYPSTAKGVKISGGNITGGASITDVIRSVWGKVTIDKGCVLTNANIMAETTLPAFEKYNTISDSTIIYNGDTNAVMFAGNYRSSFKLSNVMIESESAKLTLSASAYYAIDSCDFKNVAIAALNNDASYKNLLLRIRNTDLSYNDSFGSTSVVEASGAVYAILSGNTIFDATTAQNISYPAASATVILNSNNIIRNGIIT